MQVDTDTFDMLKTLGMSNLPGVKQVTVCQWPLPMTCHAKYMSVLYGQRTSGTRWLSSAKQQTLLACSLLVGFVLSWSRGRSEGPHQHLCI